MGVVMMSKNSIFKLEVNPIFLDNGKVEWEAVYPDLKFCVGAGDSPEEAVHEAEQYKEIYLKEIAA